MSGVYPALATLAVAVALVVAALVLAATRSPPTALVVLLDLLLVAGLLRLSAEAPWPAVGTAALVVVVRRVATSGIRRARASRSGGPAAPA